MRTRDVVLVKAFLLLMQPVLVVFEETSRGRESNAEVRDSILMGRMHPKDVASAIGAKFC